MVDRLASIGLEAGTRKCPKLAWHNVVCPVRRGRKMAQMG